MWEKIVKCFEGYPERLAVAKILIKNGLSVRNGRIYCDEIVIPALRVGRAANVDRRTVNQTVKMIESDPELSMIFRGIRPAGASLREIAKFLNFGVVEITPENAKTPGILASSASIIAEEDISIRQAIVDDPELTPEPKLILITERKIPGELIPKFLKIKGVAKVSVY
ncbi:MAG: amino acid-binding protein [Nitrososphaerota archaeon]|nr:amino acid-binding protein [Candidatus Bathyarchaeota archaeon]MDW8049226.1 amino acid-binding protein [Nitrososphaerota archaeon]